jgi:hypothetical protein
LLAINSTTELICIAYKS